MQKLKNFIPRNEGFVCEACGQNVPPAQGTFRNHCPACLTAKHVDRDVPGDRLSTCRGLMPTIAVEGGDPAALQLVQSCQACQKIHRNKRAPDDSFSALLIIMQQGLTNKTWRATKNTASQHREKLRAPIRKERT